MAMDGRRVLRFAPLSSFVEAGFWHKLTQLKLEVDKLEGRRRDVWGSYGFREAFLEVSSAAFDAPSQDAPRFSCVARGALLNENTVEAFKERDKTQLLAREGAQLWEDIRSGLCVRNPSRLTRFLILSFADLKKYRYLYWFAFPAAAHPVVYQESDPVELSSAFAPPQLSSLRESHAKLHAEQKPFFGAELAEDGSFTAVPVSEALEHISRENLHTFHFGFVDPSADENPGWTLRNFICMLVYERPSVFCGQTVKFISLRIDRRGNCDKSMLFRVAVPNNVDGEWGEKWFGWERNEKGNLGPKFTDMASSMDPNLLAESSVDLNLKLMKWRLLPDIDLDRIKATKCLLLGAGTLGCAVARNLLAWGVRSITLVDNGKVSFSNPVRQSLFNHEDCLNGGKRKAIAAADNLRKIFPGVDSNGIALHIPMPGHTVGESTLTEVRNSIETLSKLISDHDAIFLLLDSREARWLPTMLSAFFNKLVINSALGFDSYLVMRHGTSHGNESSKATAGQGVEEIKRKFIAGHELGCYFCNDVTSPGNSQKDRTLDQQCTVTRPGVANIAGALAVEIAIAITQHRNGISAQAPYNFTGEMTDDDSILGAIPHSIRGFLTNFQQILPSNGKFKQCIACSDIILNEYASKRNDFLMDVFNNAKHLEDVTGLTNMHSEAENAEVWELDDLEEGVDSDD